MKKHFDYIFIGSGIGAQLAASLLARFKKKKILIVEKHFTAGGFTHTFKRKNKFFWDVGIHYIGDLQPGSILRKLFDLMSDGKLMWQKMPEVFEKFVYPDQTFSVRDTPENYKADLVKTFPQEADALSKYFDDIRKVNAWFGRHISIRGKAPFTDAIDDAYRAKEHYSPTQSTKAYLDFRFSDDRLKSILTSQWGNYGLPPEKSAFLIHCAVVQHYLNGGYYPLGGSHKIIESIEPFITAAHGEIWTSHEVQEILIENGIATGIRVKPLRGGDQSPFEVSADNIISNTGAFNTYQKLIPASVPISFRRELEAFYSQHPVVSNVTLYLGLNRDPRELGFSGENHWIYSTYDHDANFKNGLDWIEKGKPVGAYLSFPSLKNAEATAHTAEIIAFTDYRFFERWKTQPWKKRDEAYKQLKEQISDNLIAFIEQQYPGFSAMIEFRELSTPITNEYFSSHPRGSIYGVACVPERFNRALAGFCDPVSPIKNLYLTGADVSSPGVAGAMMGAVATLAQLEDGFTLMDLMRL